MGGMDKLRRAASAAVRCSRWAVEAMRAARIRPRTSSWSPRPSGWPSWRPRPGSRDRARAVVAGGRDARTPWPRACAPRPRRWCSSTTRRGRSCHPALVDRVADAARAHGAAIPVLPVADSLEAGRRMGWSPGLARRDGLSAPRRRRARAATLLARGRRCLRGRAGRFTDEAELLAPARRPGRGRGGRGGTTSRSPCPRTWTLVARTGSSAGARPAARRARAPTATPSGPGTACGWAASRSPRRPGCTATPTATSALHAIVRRAARCGRSGRPRPARSRPATPPRAASTAASCCARSWPRLARPAGAPSSRRRDHRRAPGRGSAAARLDAMRERIAGAAGRRRDGRRGQGLDRQPVGRRGRRPASSAPRPRSGVVPR